jgi:hypothetical protein
LNFLSSSRPRGGRAAAAQPHAALSAARSAKLPLTNHDLKSITVSGDVISIELSIEGKVANS